MDQTNLRSAPASVAGCLVLLIGLAVPQTAIATSPGTVTAPAEPEPEAPAAPAPAATPPAPAATPPAPATTPPTPAATPPEVQNTDSVDPTTPTAAPPVEPPPADTGPDPLAAAQMVGTEMAGAGLYFFSYGSVVSAMSGLYRSNGPTPAPGVALGLAIGGLINVGVGAGLLLGGKRRAMATDAWLDARANRRARFEAKARRRGLYRSSAPPSDEQAATVARGQRLRLLGLGTVFLGGVLNGIGVGLAPRFPRAGLGINAAGWASVITGSVVAARGNRLRFRPQTNGRRHALTVAPSFIATSRGVSTVGVSFAGRL